MNEICPKCGKPVSEHGGAVGAAKKQAPAPSAEVISWGARMDSNSEFADTLGDSATSLNRGIIWTDIPPTGWFTEMHSVTAAGYRSYTLLGLLVTLVRGNAPEESVRASIKRVWPNATDLFRQETFNHFFMANAVISKPGSFHWWRQSSHLMYYSSFLGWVRSQLHLDIHS